MSTRSGKRIHNSFHENLLKPDVERVINSERKTRSKCVTENMEELGVSVLKSKKRTNYVSYPTDDEIGSDAVDSKEEQGKTIRSLRKNALKERNFITSSADGEEPPIDAKKPVRTTRSARKIAEDSEDSQENQQQIEEEVIMVETKKAKKGKKVKKLRLDQLIDEEPNSKKKPAKKRKKGRVSGSMIVEDIEPNVDQKTSLNKSNLSIDSFHSAAGSPRSDLEDNNTQTNITKTTKDTDKGITSSEKPYYDETLTENTERRRTRLATRHLTTNPCPITPNNKTESRTRKSNATDLDKSLKEVVLKKKVQLESHNNTLNKVAKKRKSSIMDMDSVETADATFNKGKDSTFDLEDQEKRKSMKNSTFDKIETSEHINTTYEKDTSALATRKSVKETTFDKNEVLDEKNTTHGQETEMNELASASKRQKRKSVNTTFEKSLNDSKTDIADNIVSQRKSIIINTTYEKGSDTDTNPDIKTINNDTFDKDDVPAENYSETGNNKSIRKSFLILSAHKTSELNNTFDKTEKADSTFDKTEKADSTFDKTERVDLTFDKSEKSNSTFDKIENGDSTFDKSEKSNSTFDKIEKGDSTFDKTKKSNSSFDNTEKADSTFDKTEKADLTFDKDKNLNTTFEKNSKSSLLSSDNSNITLDKSNTSRISITSDSDDSKENIVNTTPVLIESSLDESHIMNVTKSPVPPNKSPLTPLKREGTFTKDDQESPKLVENKTPKKRMSLPSPGCTPFHGNVSEKSVMNITRSVEKSRRSSLAEPLPRTTKVMFCSPVLNPAAVMQQRRKVIKSNLKGSNKSFVLEETDQRRAPVGRKRSYTVGEVEESHVKRTRLDGQYSIAGHSRSRTSSASAKLAEPTTPKKQTTPFKGKSEAKISRTKLPNFAALHQKQFDKMESLGECQQRKAKRAKQLLTPTGAVTMLERISPKETAPEQPKSSKAKSESKTPKEQPKKPETPVKSLPTLKSLNPGYTRFGFKLNLDVNPFSISSQDTNVFSFSNKKNRTKDDLFRFSSKKDNTKPLREIKALKGLARQGTLPSLAGTTSVRKEVAKQTVMREKSFTDKRSVTRNENRTVIKGVRTNRRFELQMRMRNLD